MTYSSRQYGEGIYNSGIYGLDFANSTKLTVQDSTVTGISGNKITFSSAATNGNYFRNFGAEVIFVYAKNTSGSDRTITVYSNFKCNYSHYHDYEIIVNDGDETLIGTFFNQRSRLNKQQSNIYLWYDAVSGLEIAAINIEPC